jgi:hypothetical protein
MSVVSSDLPERCVLLQKVECAALNGVCVVSSRKQLSHSRHVSYHSCLHDIVVQMWHPGILEVIGSVLSWRAVEIHGY